MNKNISETELAALIRKLNLDQLDADYSRARVSRGAYGSEEDYNVQDGWVEVKDQRIHVRNPVGGGNYPSIHTTEPVKLYVNEKEVQTEMTVSERDTINWTIEEKPLFEIIVSEDKLAVYFLLHSKQRFPWRLLNQEPANRMTLVAEQDRNHVLGTVHLKEIAPQLDVLSLYVPVDLAAIQQELMSPTHQPVLIAQGKAAVPGVDAQLELYFAQKVESRFFEEDGQVDFRNHLRIPIVNQGDVMAKKIPLIDGTPGYDVFGSVKLPSSPKDIPITAKPSVELTPDEVVVALKQGRPRITGSKVKVFDVATTYTVAGNVDIRTGNIVFSGDVIVHGDVTDNMIIESLGSVYVYGSVYNSTITATGSINVRGNVMSSKLYAGYFGVLFNRLYNTTKMLYDRFETLVAASKVLTQALEAKKTAVRFGQIVLLLLESKMKDIPDLLKELIVVISNIQQIKQGEYVKLKELAELFLKPAKLLEHVTVKLVQGFHDLLRETHQEVARMQEEHVEISINQCHRSELKSNGDIIVHCEGVIISDLFSTRNIVFIDENSVCRGSKLDAGDSITAKNVGGQTGAISVLKAKRQVDVRKMYSGRVCVGKYCGDILDVVESKVFDSESLLQLITSQEAMQMK
ncbi:flagellar assembly protein A [Cohnella soli]|uniref:Flagellar assembly protein A n=1 Tax=Cohnella soli TaxID=425005 RepID=A0ABW0I2I3_9BACL